MEADESVFTLGEDVGLYGGSYRVTEGLYAKYGEWCVRDTPISENSFTGLGVGAAIMGMRPVVEIMTINFALLALDSIVNAAAKIPFMSGGQFPMPLVVRVPSGVTRQLAAQHAQRFESMFMNVPGLRVAVPSTPQDAYWQLRQAIRSNEPIVLLEHELLYFSKGDVDTLADPPPMHRAAVRQSGRDLTSATRGWRCWRKRRRRSSRCGRERARATRLGLARRLPRRQHLTHSSPHTRLPRLSFTAQNRREPRRRRAAPRV